MNTKKISELTMMETVSDAANVLVEENGEAKRVPAKMMVAGSLPEHLQFGETVVGGDTLTWDGNTEGLTSITLPYGPTLYKVSDAVPSKDDFANGCTIFMYAPESSEPGYVASVTPDNVQSIFYDGCAVFEDGAVMIVPYDNYDADGLVLPEKGVYFISMPDMYCGKFTIPGYTGFPTKAIKTIDKQYLPGAASCTKFYNAQEDDYIYTDKACSIKASKNDVDEALSRGIIYLCSSENTYSIIGRVSFFDGYAKLLAIDVTNGNVHAYDYYSAEHIAAGPS